MNFVILFLPGMFKLLFLYKAWAEGVCADSGLAVGVNFHRFNGKTKKQFEKA